jgi:ribosome-associated protein
MPGRAIVQHALALALEKKALEPALLDVRELCSYTDYILLLSARSDRQVAAITDHLREQLKRLGQHPVGSEGEGGGQWALLDYGDAVVHVFHHPSREFYDLESLWVDAPRVAIDVPAEARISPDDPVY